MQAVEEIIANQRTTRLESFRFMGRKMHKGCVVAKRFLPTPFFGYQRWGLLPILSIFPDKRPKPVVLIESDIRIILLQGERCVTSFTKLTIARMGGKNGFEHS